MQFISFLIVGITVKKGVKETPRGRFPPYFCSEKRPGGATCKLFCETPREAFTPLFTVSSPAAVPRKFPLDEEYRLFVMNVNPWYVL